MRFLKGIIHAITESNRDKDFLMIALFLLVLIVSLISNTNKYPDTYWGKPVLSTEYPNIHKRNIEQVLVDEEHMYILPHHSTGIIQVCNKVGEYEHTLFFYEDLNGHFSMAMENGVLFVRDMKGNVYVFRQGVFDCFLKKKEAQQQLSHIDLLSNKSSPGYEIRSNSIWKSTAGGEICIVETQQANTSSSFLVVAVFCLLVVIKMTRKSRKATK